MSPLKNANKINGTFNQIEDNVMDEYAKKNISKKEMVNILKWCEHMKNKMIKELKD